MLSTSINFLNRLINYQAEDHSDQNKFFEKRREILFHRILLLSAAITLFLLLKDAFVMQMLTAAILDVAMLAIILLSLGMMHKGHQAVAKVFFLILMNSFTIFFAFALPVDRGFFFYFFPLITLSFAIFEDKEFFLRSLFVLIPAAFLIILTITDFNLLGGLKLSTAKLGKYNLIINSIIASFMVAFFVEFILRSNRQSEKLLRAMAENLKQKNEDFEKINRELDRFVYSTSHDLRAPLKSIQGLVKVALMDADRSNDEGYFKMINDRTNKLDNFIQEIIDYSRNARTELSYELVEIGKITSDVISNLQFLENADRVKFEVTDEAGIVHLDKGRLKIVLNNLVSNAIKYQSLQKSESWIKITTALVENGVQIKIEDNGIGIAEEFQNKIFEMFFRATERSSGSGLGLYIVKEIMDKMNGTISVKSILNQCTTFTLTIPLRN